MRFRYSLRHATRSALLLTAVGSFGCNQDVPSSLMIGSTVELEAAQIVSSSESLSTVRDLAVMANGTVWVLNSGEPFFVEILPDGSEGRRWGQVKEGPKGFSSPVAFVRGDPSSDQVWVLDRGRSRLVRISDGERGWAERAVPTQLARSIGPNYPYHGNPHRTRLDGESLFLLEVSENGLGDGVGFWDSALVRVRVGAPSPRAESTGTEEDPNVGLSERDRPGAIAAWELDTLLQVRGVAQPIPRTGSAVRLLPIPLMDSCPSGGSVLFDPGSGALRRFSESGTDEEVLKLPAVAPREVTPGLVFNMLLSSPGLERGLREISDTLRVRALVNAMFRVESPLFSRVLPDYADMECTGNGVWLQRFDPDGGVTGRGRRWLHVSEQGEARYYIFPERFQPFLFLSDIVWGITLEAFDVPQVARTHLR